MSMYWHDPSGEEVSEATLGMLDVPSTHVEVLRAVREFYGLMALDALVRSDGSIEPFKHSHARWLRDFQEYRANFVKCFARMVWDYTVLVSSGEMRHAKTHARMWNPALPIGGYRETVYKGVYRFDPFSVLQAAVACYSEEWGGGFGGDKWAGIAKAGLLYGKLSDEAFLDHCVDLTHNGSIYFDKHDAQMFTVGLSDKYLKFLDHKKVAEPVEILGGLLASYTLYDLVKRGVTLGFIPPICSMVFRSHHTERDIRTVLHYQPVEWGSEIFPSRLISKYCWVDCGGACKECAGGKSVSSKPVMHLFTAFTVHDQAENEKSVYGGASYESQGTAGSHGHKAGGTYKVSVIYSSESAVKSGDAA